MTTILRVAGAYLGFVLSAVVCVVTTGCQQPAREELVHSLWAAGSVSGRRANDIWVEYGGVSGRIVGIYRDLDGDGLVDDYFVFSGPSVTVLTSSANNGLLDVMRDIREPLDAATRLPKGAPEAGPYTRARLDDLAKANPMDCSFRSRNGEAARIEKEGP